LQTSPASRKRRLRVRRRSDAAIKLAPAAARPTYARKLFRLTTPRRSEVKIIQRLRHNHTIQIISTYTTPSAFAFIMVPLTLSFSGAFHYSASASVHGVSIARIGHTKPLASAMWSTKTEYISELLKKRSDFRILIEMFAKATIGTAMILDRREAGTYIFCALRFIICCDHSANPCVTNSRLP